MCVVEDKIKFPYNQKVGEILNEKLAVVLRREKNIFYQLQFYRGIVLIGK